MKKIIVITALLVIGWCILIPSVSRWLEVKNAELFSESLEERNKDSINMDIPTSPATDVYVTKANIYMNQGTVYFEKGYLYAAIYCYDKAINLDPLLTLAYINRGKVYSQQGQLDKAISDFNHAIRIDSNSTEAYRLRSFTYLEKGDFNRSISDCNNAIEARANRQQELDIHKAPRDTDPNEADSYWVRGVANQYKGDFAQALSDYNQAIEIGSTFHPEAYYLDRAKLYLQMRAYDKSWEDVHKIESLGSKVDPAFLRKLKKQSGSQK